MSDNAPGPSADLDDVLGLDPDDEYAMLRDRLADADDHLLEELVILRKCKKLTQSDVAKAMQRSKTAVSNFERLGSDPHLSTVRRYAAAIGALITHTVDDYDSWRIQSPPPLEIRHRYISRAVSPEIGANEGVWDSSDRFEFAAGRQS